MEMEVSRESAALANSPVLLQLYVNRAKPGSPKKYVGRWHPTCLLLCGVSGFQRRSSVNEIRLARQNSGGRSVGELIRRDGLRAVNERGRQAQGQSQNRASLSRTGQAHECDRKGQNRSDH